MGSLHLNNKQNLKNVPVLTCQQVTGFLIHMKNHLEGTPVGRECRAGDPWEMRRTDALRQNLSCLLRPQHQPEDRKKERGSPKGPRKGSCGPEAPALRQDLPPTALFRVPDCSEIKPALVMSTAADNSL